MFKGKGRKWVISSNIKGDIDIFPILKYEDNLRKRLLF